MADAKYLLSKIDLTSFGLGSITPLSVEEVIKLEEEGVSKLLTPFLYNQLFTKNNDNFFDYLFIEDIKMYEILKMLLESLKIIYITNKIEFKRDESNKINIIISDANINQFNFEKLCEIIFDIFFLKSNDDESENRVIQVAEENKAILEEYLRLEQQHKHEMEELNKKNKKSLHQIVTIVASQCLWDYDKVLNMTYYRLIVTYMSIFEIDNFTIYMQYATSGQFDMKNKQQKHWSEIIGK